MRSDGDWRSIFRWCASILSSYLWVEFRVGSQPLTTESLLILWFRAVVRVKLDERHVLERNELSKINASMKFTLDVYILTNTASLDH